MSNLAIGISSQSESPSFSHYELLKSAFIGNIIGDYVRGKENAYEAYKRAYSSTHEQTEGETDIDYILRCAEQDFDDCYENAGVYQDYLVELTAKIQKLGVSNSKVTSNIPLPGLINTELVTSLLYMTDMANNYIDDINSGLIDGTYNKDDNLDINEKENALQVLETYLSNLGISATVQTDYVSLWDPNHRNLCREIESKCSINLLTGIIDAETVNAEDVDIHVKDIVRYGSKEFTVALNVHDDYALSTADLKTLRSNVISAAMENIQSGIDPRLIKEYENITEDLFQRIYPDGDMRDMDLSPLINSLENIKEINEENMIQMKAQLKFRFSELTPSNQKKAKAMFIDAGPRDRCLYVLDKNGSVLCRQQPVTIAMGR